MALKSDAIFKGKLAGGLKNGIRNLVNFHGSSRKSENLHFDGIFLSIVYKVSAKKVQKSYLSWRWRVIQTLKKNLIFVWKMIWGIWWILTRTVESLKMCTLIGYFCWKYVMFELKNTEELHREKWVMASKMTLGFWWIFTQVVESNVR